MPLMAAPASRRAPRPKPKPRPTPPPPNSPARRCMPGCSASITRACTSSCASKVRGRKISRDWWKRCAGCRNQADPGAVSRRKTRSGGVSMSRRIVLIAAAAVLAVAVIGFVALDRALYGIPGFHLARGFSRGFRGAHRAKVNGISLHYEIYGQGPPVLVLHGAGAFLESMHYFISALAPGHTVIAVDSRGQGRSTDSGAPLTYAAMGSDMIQLMDTLRLKQADVVGWSDGGIVGLDMAMKHPGRVRRLVAIGANYDTAGIDAKQMTPAMLDAQTRQGEPLYDLIRSEE